MDDESIDNSTESSNESSEAASWWIDEGVAGVGERPQWLPEKFKTVADMSKSYNELEKRFGTAPKEYDLSKAEGWIDPQSDTVKSIAQMAKQKGVPQDFMDSVFENVGSYIKSQSIDPLVERQKLGENADKILGELNDWAKSNLSENAFNALTKSMTTAEAIQAMMELKGKMSNSLMQVPVEGSEKLKNDDSIEKIENEMLKNREQYNSDPEYRKELKQRMSKLMEEQVIPISDFD